MRHLVQIALILVGILHLLPLAGVLGPDRLASMYGITADEPNLAILMRHREVLFGILGALLVGTGSVQRDPFLLSLAAAFPVFTAHQVLHLVRLADANTGGKVP